jgi:hypothetical protein
VLYYTKWALDTALEQQADVVVAQRGRLSIAQSSTASMPRVFTLILQKAPNAGTSRRLRRIRQLSKYRPYLCSTIKDDRSAID